MLTEDLQERRNFDAVTAEIHGGDPLAAVQTALTMWAKQAPRSGSYGCMLTIFANEVEKARAKLQPSLGGTGERQGASDVAETKKTGFVQVDTVNRAHVQWFWTQERLHDTDYHLKVSDAVQKAVKQAEQAHDVTQDRSYRCQWEGVLLEGENLDGVRAAGQDVAKVLARFKGAIPLGL